MYREMIEKTEKPLAVAVMLPLSCFSAQKQYDREARNNGETFHKDADMLKEYLINSGCTAVIQF